VKDEVGTVSDESVAAAPELRVQVQLLQLAKLVDGEHLLLQR
jgi:hypothetical protein